MLKLLGFSLSILCRVQLELFLLKSMFKWIKSMLCMYVIVKMLLSVRRWNVRRIQLYIGMHLTSKKPFIIDEPTIILNSKRIPASPHTVHVNERFKLIFFSQILIANTIKMFTFIIFIYKINNFRFFYGHIKFFCSISMDLFHSKSIMQCIMNKR